MEVYSGVLKNWGRGLEIKERLELFSYIINKGLGGGGIKKYKYSKRASF